MTHRRHATIVRLLAVLIAAGSVTALRADEPKPADPMVGKEAGDVRDDNGLAMKLVWCPAGFVSMEQVEVISEPGAAQQPNDNVVNPNKPARKPQTTTIVTSVSAFLTRGYWLGKYEVTQADWTQVMDAEPWKGKEHIREGADFPATFVSWNDAMEFSRKLTDQERKGGRLPDGWEYTLPTEAQWERACRARTETRFSFGDDDSKLGEYAWIRDNSEDAGEFYGHRVGQKKPNPWGVHDMHGNMWEWCRDVHTEKLPGGRDPEVTKGTSYRVVRGGGCDYGASLCRSAFRTRNLPTARFAAYGFRVALSPVLPAAAAEPRP